MPGGPSLSQGAEVLSPNHAFVETFRVSREKMWLLMPAVKRLKNVLEPEPADRPNRPEDTGRGR